MHRTSINPTPVERGKHMSTFLNTMITQARSDKQTIVLPEGADPRTIEAAREILETTSPSSSSSETRTRSLNRASTSKALG